MTVSECHSCDFFPGGKLWTTETVPIAREVAVQSLALLRETTARIVRYAKILGERFSGAALESLCPLVVHSLFRVCVTLAWMDLEENSGNHATQKAICVEVLRRFDHRWKAAGTILNIPLLFRCHFLIDLGVYLATLEALEKEYKSQFFQKTI